MPQADLQISERIIIALLAFIEKDLSFQVEPGSLEDSRAGCARIASSQKQGHQKQ
jgi:hypothetical protein